MNSLEKRCVDITYSLHLTHLGGVLTSVNIIDQIYSIKPKEYPFILDNGHCALALYVVLEKYGFGDAEELFKKHGTHPGHDEEHGIFCSTGSLGQGMTVAIGMALANRKRDVYVLTSDGAMAEGCNWEALRIASEQRLENLKITVNANGHAGYSKIDPEWLDIRMQSFYPCLVLRPNLFKYPEWLQDINSHYVGLNEERYKELLKC